MGTHLMWQRERIGSDPAPAKAAARPARPVASREIDGLQLVDEPPRRKPSRIGAAGFDPYACDAGFAKPHSWERVDHD